MSDYTAELYYQVSDEAKAERYALLTARLADLACMAEATLSERDHLQAEMTPQGRLF